MEYLDGEYAVQATRRDERRITRNLAAAKVQTIFTSRRKRCRFTPDHLRLAERFLP